MNIPFNDLSRSKSLNKGFFVKLEELLLSGHYLFGPHTKELEESLSVYLNIPYVRAVSSGTSALTLALKSLNLPENSTIIASANSGSYARIAAEQAKLQTKYVDVDLNGIISLPQLKALDDNEACALVVTHLYGQIGDMLSLKEYCQNREIFLIEDCAQSFGATFEKRRAGSWGDIGVFSFYPTKNLAAMGDAGAIATSSSELFARIQALSQYGWGNKYSVEIKGGENSRIDEIQAFILCNRLEVVDDQNRKRRKIWRRYADALQNTTYRLLGTDADCFVAHLAVIDASQRRDDFRTFLQLRGIQTAIHYPIPDYQQEGFSDESISLPNTEYLTNSIFSIPIFPELTETEVQYICDALKDFAHQPQKVEIQ